MKGVDQSKRCAKSQLAYQPRAERARCLNRKLIDVEFGQNSNLSSTFGFRLKIDGADCVKNCCKALFVIALIQNDMAMEAGVQAGMVIGIAGGVIALLIGVIFVFLFGALGGAAGMAGAGQTAVGSGLGALVSLGLPIMTIVGGALAKSNPKAALVLLGVPGAVLALFGLYAISNGGVLFLVLGGLFLVGAFLIYREVNATPN